MEKARPDDREQEGADDDGGEDDDADEDRWGSLHRPILAGLGCHDRPDMTDAMPPITVADYEAPAAEIVAAGAWDYYAGGAGDERSLADNLAAWQRLRFRPRVLVDVAERDLRTTAFGVELPHPVIVAPMAAHDLAHPDAERATARGAAAAGALLTLSTISSVAMEDVAALPPLRRVRAGFSSTHRPTGRPARRSSSAPSPPDSRPSP